MDQPSPELPSLVELPKPEVKKLSKLPNPNEMAAQTVEETVGARAVEQGTSQPMAVPSFQAPTPAPFVGAPAVVPVPGPTAPIAGGITLPPIADDVDLIEKEWVIKAKTIVAQTKDDPYHQNKVMSQVKADYLKKRFNREVKVNET